MAPHVFKLAYQRQGIGYFAELELSIAQASEQIIEFKLAGSGFHGQGYAEDAPDERYGNWGQGARVGARFALKALDDPALHIVFYRLTGRSTDTTPWIMAEAAAKAVWAWAGFTAPAPVLKRLEQLSGEGWSARAPFP